MNMAAPRSMVQHIPDDGGQQDQRDTAVSQLCTKRFERFAKPQQRRSLFLDIDISDRFRTRIPQLQGGKHGQCPQRHDEGRQFDISHQHAVDPAHHRPGGHANHDRERNRKAKVDRKVSHDQRRDHQNRADRQVDARGQDHQCLGDGHDPGDCHLLQHGRKRACAQEPRCDDTEGKDAEDQNKRRNRRWVIPQERPRDMDQRLVILGKCGDGFVRLGQFCLEVRDGFGW